MEIVGDCNVAVAAHGRQTRCATIANQIQHRDAKTVHPNHGSHALVNTLPATPVISLVAIKIYSKFVHALLVPRISPPSGRKAACNNAWPTDALRAFKPELIRRLDFLGKVVSVTIGSAAAMGGSPM